MLPPKFIPWWQVAQPYHHFRVGRELGQHLFPAAAHLAGILQGAFQDELFQGIGTSIPEIGDIEGSVVDSGRIDGPQLPLHTHGDAQPVVSTGSELMTMGATDAVVAREANVAEQLPAQFHQLRLQPFRHLQRRHGLPVVLRSKIGEKTQQTEKCPQWCRELHCYIASEDNCIRSLRSPYW